MSLQNLEFSKCVHNFFPSMKTNSKNVSNLNPEISMCKKCGIMKINSITLEKLEEFKYCCEHDQLFLYNEIVENSIQRDITETNTSYLKKRHHVIDYIKKMCNNLKFLEETYHQAVEYADTILCENSRNNLKYDLIAIGCLLLSGKSILNMYLFLAKFVQNDPALPDNNSFLNQKREFYDGLEVVKAELTCLKLMRYKLNALSAYSIMKYFLNNGIVYSRKMDEVIQLYSLSFNILCRVMYDSRGLFFSNLQIALSSILIASSFICNTISMDVIKILDIVYDCKFEYFRDANCLVYE